MVLLWRWRIVEGKGCAGLCVLEKKGVWVGFVHGLLGFAAEIAAAQRGIGRLLAGAWREEKP